MLPLEFGFWLWRRLGSLLRPAFRASDPVSPCGFPIDLGGVLACFRAPEVSEPFSFETDIRLYPSLRKRPLTPFRRESPIVGKPRPTRAFCFAGVRVNFFRGCGGPFFIRERGVHGFRGCHTMSIYVTRCPRDICPLFALPFSVGRTLPSELICIRLSVSLNCCDDLFRCATSGNHCVENLGSDHCVTLPALKLSKMVMQLPSSAFCMRS